MLELIRQLMQKHPEVPLFGNQVGEQRTANSVRRRLRGKLELPDGLCLLGRQRQ